MSYSSVMTQSGTASQTTTHCHRCGRLLRSTKSVAAGLGPVCAAKIAEAAIIAARTDPTTQVDKAVELIEDGAIVPVTPTVYLAVSTDGSVNYEVNALAGSCSCKAGQYGRRCFHLLAAEWFVGWTRFPVASVATVSPKPADPFAVFDLAA